LKFYIAGRNAPAWFVKRLKYENVIYCGEVENAAEFMNRKAVMIVPLFSGSGMRIKIIEGMLMGKAIITTTIGTEGIPSKDCHNILIANTPKAFITQINTIVKDRKLYDTISENAFAFVRENFDNLRIAEAVMKFYEKCF